MVERVTTKGRAANDDAPVTSRADARKVDKPHAAAKPGYDKKTIALVYDFDGTLSPEADAGIHVPAQDRRWTPKAFWAESNRVAREQGADPLITYMHLMYKKAKEKGVRIDRERSGRARPRRRAVPRRRGVVRRDRATTSSCARESQGVDAAPLPRLVGPDRDHRGHVDLRQVPQRVRLGILVRGLRPALSEARHHRHRQDAVPVPHQQGHRGPGREHQPAHARGRSGRSRSPT